MTNDSSSLQNNLYDPIPLSGAHFSGWAMYPHLTTTTTISGLKTTVRTPFAQKLYATLFQGEDRYMEEIIVAYVNGIETLFNGETFDCLLMLPPPTNRRDYNQAIRMVSGISKMSKILSLQHVIRQRTAESGVAAFAFASDTVSGLFAQAKTLVITDFYRSGKSLHSLCRFLVTCGRTEKIVVLSGTVVHSKYGL